MGLYTCNCHCYYHTGLPSLRVHCLIISPSRSAVSPRALQLISYVEHGAQREKLLSQLKWMVGFGAIMLIIMALAVFGVSVAAALLTRQLSVQNSDFATPTLVKDRSGETLRTAAAELTITSQLRPEDDVIAAVNETVAETDMPFFPTMVYIESIPIDMIYQVGPSLSTSLITCSHHNMMVTELLHAVAGLQGCKMLLEGHTQVVLEHGDKTYPVEVSWGGGVKVDASRSWLASEGVAERELVRGEPLEGEISLSGPTAPHGQPSKCLFTYWHPPGLQSWWVC